MRLGRVELFLSLGLMYGVRKFHVTFAWWILPSVLDLLADSNSVGSILQRFL